MNSKRDWIGLSMAAGLGPAGFWQLLHRFGSPSAVLDAGYQEIKHVQGLRTAQISGLADSEALRARAELELSNLAKLEATALTGDDPAYPELLRNCTNPPPVLYIQGHASSLNKVAVAVVGSRAATGYGRRTAFAMGRGLALNQVSVVSGLAAGIDAEAHGGALNGGGVTIGVLGCGLDVIYPRTNRKLYAEVAEKGALVTEYCLGTKPEGFRFPARNRIIAGMCRAVVVVEAAKKSGSLITVQFALEEGREVFAVPGQVDSVKSGGTHWLLQQGATLAVGAEDVLAALGNDGVGSRCEAPAGLPEPQLDEETARLFAIIDSYPVKRDELIEKTGISAAMISEQLLLLELEGLIEILPGDQVRRTVP